MCNAMRSSIIRYFLISTIASLIACRTIQQRGTQTKIEINKVTGTQILDSNAIIIKIDTIGNYPFNPLYKNYDCSEKDITLANNIFIDTLTKRNGSRSATSINYPKNYKRQILFVKDKFGHKLAWINCFCDSPWINTEWRKKIISFYDGGDCFFQVLIDLTDEKCVSFLVNGNVF